jgi:TolB-like protein/cytochrome c-type biogenesis protein CcmH/NrfG
LERFGKFEILERIASGGFGEVFKAYDPAIKRSVAIKTCTLGDERTRRRFALEAEIAGNLHHRNITTIYDFGVEGDTPYLVQELLQGEDLDRKIKRRDEISYSRKLTYLLQLAHGLEHAHGAGVVHRDLKPGNIHVLADGTLKIMDFGIARLLHQETGLTETGQTVGTTAYLAPEQIRGEDLDQRVDIFAFGALAYELLTYERAFNGDTISSLMYQIISQEPEPIRTYWPECPADLTGLIERCLDKDPDGRPQEFSEIVGELNRIRGGSAQGRGVPTQAAGSPGPPSSDTPSARSRKIPIEPPVPRDARHLRPWVIPAIAAIVLAVAAAAAWFAWRAKEGPEPESLTPAAAAPEHHSIAVLAFADMSENKDQEYLSDGIAEELLNLLARIPELRVTARTSAFAFKGRNLEIPEIARRLDVAHILQGSVRKAGNQVRVTVQLIEAGSDSQLWSETYDRTLDDIFAIQDEIAADVVTKLEVELLAALPVVEETDPGAYALILQARHLIRLANVEGYEKAVDLLRQALALNPDSAVAWAELAQAYFRQADRGLRPLDEGYRLAREAANKALNIDPDSAPAYARLSWVAMFYDHDLAAAARYLERALRLQPSNTSFIGVAAILARNLGRVDEAIALNEYLAAHDPVNPRGHGNLGNAYYSAGRLDEAIDSWRSALALSPGRIGAHGLIGAALLLQGEPEAALEAIEREPLEVFRLLGLVPVHHARGKRAESDAALNELIEKYERDSAYNIAHAVAYRGEVDRAFDWLNKAVEYSDPGLSNIVTEPLFVNLYSDPRWLSFLRKIGMAPEQLAVIEFNVTLPE